MKLTRRELAGVVAAGTAAARANAQQTETPEQLVKSAAEDLRHSVEKIRKFKVPAVTEPAFSFRAQ